MKLELHFRDWFGPRCQCIEYARQQLAEGKFTEPTTKTIWDDFKAADHPTLVSKWITDGDLAENQDSQKARKTLETAQTRCLETLRGLIATIDAAALITNQTWRAGVTLPREIEACLTNALVAYQSAWGLAPGGKKLPLLSRNFAGTDSIALEAMFEMVRERGIDEETAPAWLAVHRLLDYLLSGAASTPVPAASAVTSSFVGTSDLPRPRPGSPENPVLARVLLVRQGSRAGQLHDLFAMRQDEGPASWYLDPVQFGLTAFQPNFVDSLRLAWRACQAAQPRSAAIRLAPSLADCKVVDGPSAGAVAACAMYAALVGEQLNSDASVSAALTLRPGRSLDDGRPINLLDISLDKVGATKEKLDVAHRGRPKASRQGPYVAPLRKVVFTESQAGQAIEAKWHQSPSGPAIAVHGAANLAEVYTHLTGNARIERVLDEYARQRREEWEQAWTDPDSERGSLLYYVAPAYRLFDRQTGKRDVELFVQLHEAATGDDGDYQLRHDDIDLPDEEAALVKLWHEGGELLCMSEGPGAGKTTFTRRLLAFLCGRRAQSELADHGPLVALRWEESAESADEEWPTDFPAAIAGRLESACRECGHATSAADAARYALEHGTVVLILDALDQAAPARVQGFHQFLKRLRHEKQWRVRVVLTGRTYAVDAIKQSLAAVGDWRFGAVLPFDRRRQHAYFYGPVRRARPSDPSLPRDFEEAQVRRLAGELPASADENNLLRALNGIVPFYADVAELLGNPNTLFMVRRLAENRTLGAFQTRSELYCQTSGFLLSKAARKLRRWPTDDRPVDELAHRVDLADIRRWESLLAAAAFTMMTIRPGHFRVSNQVEIAELRSMAAAKIENRPTDDEWRLLEQVAQFTNHSLLYASNEQVWAWPDRRMMEFYCGLHMARNSQPGWVRSPCESDHPPACGDPAVRANAANPDWHGAFLHAIELPADRRDDGILLASLAELFPRVSQRARQDGELPWLRPTELIYRAWCLLEELPANERAQSSPQLLPGGQRVLDAFRSQFQRQLTGESDTVTVVAHELNDGFVTLSAPVHPQCTTTPSGRLSPSSFELGRTAVTREQFALFDDAYLSVHAPELSTYSDQSPRCPAQWLSWYDAWCAARYFGGRLPSEKEWEHACGAGSAAAYCRITTEAVPGYRDLENDRDLNRVADYGRDCHSGPIAVGQLQPNSLGLYDMHGGVWEWCVNWYGEFSADASAARAARGPYRVLRGGAWSFDAHSCSTSYRFKRDPASRSSYQGLRLARVPAGEAKRALAR